MKNLLINFAFAVSISLLFLFCSADAYAACANSYDACRCDNGLLATDTCCTYKNSGQCNTEMSKGRITGGGTKLVGMVCKTPCPTSCTSGTRILSISYSEDGECCSKLVDKDTGTGTIAECTPGAKQVCTQGVGGTYLKGGTIKTCGSNSTWGSCQCDNGTTSSSPPGTSYYNLCNAAGGMWSITLCECLCCRSGCTARWNGTTPICDCSPIGGPYESRVKCTS